MKKNLLNLMSVLFVTLAIFTLASCGDDDDKGSGTPSPSGFNNALLGSWNDNYGHLFTFVMGPNGQITGSANGDAVTWYINTNGQLVGTEYDRDVKIYNYSIDVNNNKLTLTRVNDDDHETYVLYRSGSGGGDTPSGAQIDQKLLGVWVGTKTGDDDTYTFTFTQNGEGNKKEFNQHEGDLDYKTFTWSINTDGQLVIRERGDNRAKIYSYVVEGNRTLILTRLYDDDYDVYHLER